MIAELLNSLIKAMYFGLLIALCDYNMIASMLYICSGNSMLAIQCKFKKKVANSDIILPLAQ